MSTEVQEIVQTAADLAKTGEGSPVDRFDQAEAELAKLPRLELEPVHRFAPGIYARELTIPAGVALTGKVHRSTHLNIISKGEISVYSADEGVRRIKAPFSFVAGPGTRRIGFAHEDTVWTTIHANPSNTEDLKQLEADHIIPHVNPRLSTEKLEAIK